MHYCSDSSQPLHQMAAKWMLQGKNYAFLPTHNIGREQRHIELGSDVNAGRLGRRRFLVAGKCTIVIMFPAWKRLSELPPHSNRSIKSP